MNSPSQGLKRFVIKQSELPAQYPTHCHSAEFWEHLGRTVATYGFLEEMLKKAIFALTATRRYDTSEELEEVYTKWEQELQIVLSDTLGSLAGKYLIAARNHHDRAFPASKNLYTTLRRQRLFVMPCVMAHGARQMKWENRCLHFIIRSAKDSKRRSTSIFCVMFNVVLQNILAL